MIKNKRATILIKTYRMKTNRIWWVCLLGEFFFFFCRTNFMKNFHVMYYEIFEISLFFFFHDASFEKKNSTFS